MFLFGSFFELERLKYKNLYVFYLLVIILSLLKKEEPQARLSFLLKEF